jgi:hypothetical protein
MSFAFYNKKLGKKRMDYLSKQYGKVISPLLGEPTKKFKPGLEQFIEEMDRVIGGADKEELLDIVMKDNWFDFIVLIHRYWELRNAK